MLSVLFYAVTEPEVGSMGAEVAPEVPHEPVPRRRREARFPEACQASLHFAFEFAPVLRGGLNADTVPVSSDAMPEELDWSTWRERRDLRPKLPGGVLF